IDRLTESLAACLDGGPEDVPDLESVLGKKRSKRRAAAGQAAPPAKLPGWLSSGAPAAIPVIDLARNWQIVAQRPGDRTEGRWTRKDPVGIPVAPASVTAPASPASSVSSVIGRVMGRLRQAQRPLPTEAGNEIDVDAQREEVHTVAPGMDASVACVLGS